MTCSLSALVWDPAHQSQNHNHLIRSDCSSIRQIEKAQVGILMILNLNLELSFFFRTHLHVHIPHNRFPIDFLHKIIYTIHTNQTQKVVSLQLRLISLRRQAEDQAQVNIYTDIRISLNLLDNGKPINFISLT